MKRNLLFCLSCLLLLQVGEGIAQTYPFKNYTIENGLPQSTVYHAFQDQKGYVWAGTQGGVCRFDGRAFQIWDATSGLPDNHVTSIEESPDGTIWLGHRGGRLSLLKNDQLRKFEHTNYTNGAYVEDLLWERGNLWIATDGNGLYRINIHEADTTVDHFSVENGLGSNVVNDLLLYQNRALYIATLEGVSIFDLSEKVVSSFSEDDHFNRNVNALCLTQDDRLWLATSTGLLQVNLKNKADYKSYHLNDGLKDEFINDVKADASGNIWLASDMGIARLNGDEIINYTKKNGLLSNIAYSILEDREGAIWVSQDDGLSRYDRSPFLIYNTNDGLINNEVYSIIQHEDAYWIATAEGISIFNPDHKPGDQFKDFTTEHGLSGNFVYSLFVDGQKNIWIGTIGNGAACYNPVTGAFRYFNQSHGLKGDDVVNIGEDKMGRIWFALLDGGLARYDYEKDTLQNFNAETGAYTNSAWSIYKDKTDQLWFGTTDQGLMYLDTLNDNVVPVPGQEYLFNTNFGFGSLSGDEQGNIWIASIGGGLLKYDGKSFSQYGIREGLKSNNPYFVFYDSVNSILLGTNTGLDIFNPLTLSTKSVGKEDGFLGIETNQNAVFRDQQSDIWIGTVNGLVRYRPSDNADKLAAPSVHLLKQRLFFKDTVLADNVELSHQEDYITFDFTGISFSNADKLRFRYLLEGFDREWSPEIQESHVTFTNLPPGNYTFKVKAGYEGGEWSEKAASFNFSIMSPYWERWWFILLAMVSMLVVLYSFYRYRINQLLQVQKVKNDISADLHDDIGSRLTNIQLLSAISKSKLEAGFVPEANAYLKSIDEEAHASAEALDEIVWNIKLGDENLEDMIARMRRYAADILENDRIDYSIKVKNGFNVRTMQMEKRRELFLVFKEALNNIRKHAKAANVEIRISIDQEKFYLAVQDDGKGFDLCNSTNRNGIRNMKDRVNKWKGNIKILSEINQGTYLEIWMPFDKKSFF